MGALRSDASSMAVVINGVDEYVFRQGGSLASNPKDVCTMGMSKIAAAVAQASTSGTFFDFPNIPAWARRITVVLEGVSTNGASPPQVQLGTSSGLETSGYQSNACGGPTANSLFGINSTSGILAIGFSAAANSNTCVIILTRINGNLWVVTGTGGTVGSTGTYMLSGSKSLGGVLDRLRVTTVNGTDVFDAGTINVMWE